MENLKKLLQWLKTFPIWIRAVLLLLITAFLLLLSLNSCGSTTKAVVSNPKDSTVTKITITTNNPSEFNINPDTDLEVKPNKN